MFLGPHFGDFRYGDPEVTPDHDEQWYSIYLTLIIETPPQLLGHGQTIYHAPITPDSVEVSITADIFVKRQDGHRGRDAGGGQSIDSLRLVDSDRAREVADLWERWHLNGARSGCAHQGEPWTCTREVLPDKWRHARLAADARNYPPKPVCNTLNGWAEIRRLFGEHPYPRDGYTCHACGRHRWDEPTDHCSETGYRWGSAHLYEPVPDEVLARLRQLFGKPEGWTVPNRYLTNSKT